MKSLTHIRIIAQKDLKLFFIDRLALFFFVIFPFFFVIVFSYLLKGVGGQDERLVLNLVTQEAAGGMSYQVIQTLETKDETKLAPGEPQIVWLKDYDKARQDVADQKLAGFLAFPADFTQGVLMGYGAELEVVADAEATNVRAALNGLARAIAVRLGAQRVATEATIGLMVEQGTASGSFSDIEEAVRQLFAVPGGLATPESPIAFKTEKVGEVEAKSATNYTVPGYLVMFVFFAAALSAETIVRERQNHTLERILTTSVGRSSILLGTFAGVAAKGLIQVLIFWTVGILAFRVDLGPSPAAVITLTVLMVIMSSAIAVMLATLVKSQRSAGSLAVLTSLVLAPLGGCWWPLFITPKWMQFIAKFVPHGWATTGFNKLMLSGADFGAVLPETLALAGFAIIFGIIGLWRFRTNPA